jgi:formylglycine-generating enzyme required for sulfatase activity
MVPNFKIARAGMLLVLLVATPGCAVADEGPLVAVELETVVNTLDGCMGCGCRAKGELEEGAQKEWWITFGLAQSDDQNAWAAADSSSRCGAGSFDKVVADFRRTVGTPYVVLDLPTAAVVPRKGSVGLKTRVRTKKLSGFDKKGQPVYESSEQERKLAFSDEGGITLPVLIPNERERESFGVYEVLLRLRATVLGRGPAASYGVVTVSADVPGAEVLLDGGFVGRIAEGRPMVVENVQVGSREIHIRDFAGREVRHQVLVKKAKTADVSLEVLNLPADEPRAALLPLGRNPQGHEEYWRVQDGALVVRIPAGGFLRGSPEDEGEPHERPQRQVHISEFLIDKTEVTWRQFRKYAEATGASLPAPPLWGSPDDYPASAIIWEEAKGYCEWVGGRLPTEAEWEKAARGTDGRKYPWGDQWDHERCNSRDGGPHRLLSAGSYPNCLSPYGVLDMAGSVWEWCSDWYGETYYAEGPIEDPKGPTQGRTRVLRGGAWVSPDLWLRPGFRYTVSPTFRNVNYGFRCVQEPLDS